MKNFTKLKKRNWLAASSLCALSLGMLIGGTALAQTQVPTRYNSVRLVDPVEPTRQVTWKAVAQDGAFATFSYNSKLMRVVKGGVSLYSVQAPLAGCSPQGLVNGATANSYVLGINCTIDGIARAYVAIGTTLTPVAGAADPRAGSSIGTISTNGLIVGSTFGQREYGEPINRGDVLYSLATAPQVALRIVALPRFSQGVLASATNGRVIAHGGDSGLIMHDFATNVTTNNMSVPLQPIWSINARGDMAGDSNAGARIVRADGTSVALPALFPDSNSVRSVVTSINDAGWAVGQYSLAQSTSGVAFVYAGGVVSRLADVVNNPSKAVSGALPRDINAGGVILAERFLAGANSEIYRITPDSLDAPVLVAPGPR